MMLGYIRDKFQMKFKDRGSAANILAEALKDIIKKNERGKKALVLGVARGGVIIADIIAKKLPCEFGIIIPMKLRAPNNKELAIGAVMEGGLTYLNELIVEELEISPDYIEMEKLQQLAEIKRRTSFYYSGNRVFADCRDINFDSKTIILADDGTASGATIIAAARWIRATKSPHRLIITVPIVPKDTLDLLKSEKVGAVEVITSPTRSNFKSVQQYYHNFEQITDEEVIGIIDRNRIIKFSINE